MVICWTIVAANPGFSPASQMAEPHAGMPDHEIRYEEKLSPAWKSTWDFARQLYRDRKYKEALVQYEILLTQKENVDEARWECTSILLGLERWPQARRHLESLLAHDPENQQYLLASARVYVETGNAEQAARLYRQLYEAAPDGSGSLEALEGLVRALDGKGSAGELLPLMELLVARKPDSMELLRKLAALQLEVGRTDEARAILDRLERHSPNSHAVIDMQARVHASDGDQEGAVRYWQKLVTEDKDNLEANRALQAYYAGKGNWGMSLKHLEAVLRYTPDAPDLLEQAAGLNMKLGRIDGALRYYEYCLALKPGDLNLRNRKKAAQRILASDLLVLVENGGGQKLWHDLAQVTTDRAGVFREIATLLREQGRNEELVDVLALLYRDDPEGAAYQELAFLLAKTGRSDELITIQQLETTE